MMQCEKEHDVAESKREKSQQSEKVVYNQPSNLLKRVRNKPVRFRISLSNSNQIKRKLPRKGVKTSKCFSRGQSQKSNQSVEKSQPISRLPSSSSNNCLPFEDSQNQGNNYFYLTSLKIS